MASIKPRFKGIACGVTATGLTSLKKNLKSIVQRKPASAFCDRPTQAAVARLTTNAQKGPDCWGYKLNASDWHPTPAKIS